MSVKALARHSNTCFVWNTTTLWVIYNLHVLQYHCLSSRTSDPCRCKSPIIHHPWWKNGKFLSPLIVIIENNVLGIYCLIKWWKPRFFVFVVVVVVFFNFREGFFTGFSQITSLCMTLHTYSLLNMTRIFVPKSLFCLKKWRWGTRLWIGTSTLAC